MTQSARSIRDKQERKQESASRPSQIPADLWERLLPYQRGALANIASLTERAAFDPLFWEYWHELYNRDVGADHALIGAWGAVGREGRGKLKSAYAFAEFIGQSANTLYAWLHEEQLAREVWALRDLYFKDRIADVDEASYRAAISGDGTAADRKLFYQLAGVMNEDSMNRDDWMTVLTTARAQIEAEEPHDTGDQEDCRP